MSNNTIIRRLESHRRACACPSIGVRLSIAMCFFGALSTSTFAATDQVYNAVSSGGTSGIGLNQFGVTNAQVVIAGLAGRLVEVSIQIRRKMVPAPNDDLIVELRSTSSGFPDGPSGTLFTTIVERANIPVFNFGASETFVPVDVSGANLNLALGDSFAIVARPRGTGDYIWIGTTFDGYVGGDAAKSIDFGETFLAPNRGQNLDLGFATSVAPVPLPSAVWLMMSGVLACARHVRSQT